MSVKPNKYAFLFDLDGVLVDTARFHFIAWRRLANELGFDFTEEENEALKGVGRVESLHLILNWGNKALDDQKFQEALTKKNSWYLEMVNDLSSSDLLLGAKDFLEATKSAGISTGLGSASKNARQIINHLEINHLLDVIVDGTQVSRSKPDPEVFLKGAAQLAVSAINCVVFEDAIAGIQAARSANMKCVGISNDLTALPADIVVPNLAALNLNSVKQLFA